MHEAGVAVDEEHAHVLGAPDQHVQGPAVHAGREPGTVETGHQRRLRNAPGDRRQLARRDVRRQHPGFQQRDRGVAARRMETERGAGQQQDRRQPAAQRGHAPTSAASALARARTSGRATSIRPGPSDPS
jgi:hypothetical protein